MIRLILKIFLAYWIAAGVVIVIGDFGPHWQIHHPELSDALNSSLAMNGQLLIGAYETGRCSQVRDLLIKKDDALSRPLRMATVCVGTSMSPMQRP